MSAYYNEFDKNAAAWLRELIKAGMIAPGDVDERSIEDVLPNDLSGYTQCHFFAGIGVWSYALRRAGWPDDRPVWTGSCPCQPFSAAGKGAAFDDERHLWPAFHHLIKERRPVAVLGEQVASKDADAWIDLVQTDLEGVGYAFGAVPFPSAGVGAPHIRDRMYWVADAGVTLGDTCGTGLERYAGNGCATGRQGSRGSASTDGVSGRLADMHINGRGQARPSVATTGGNGVIGNGSAFGVADSELQQRPNGQSRVGDADEAAGWVEGSAEASGLFADSRPGPTNGYWRDSDWLFCRDGKWRPVEPGTFPLVAGAAKGVLPSSNIGLPINANETGEARVMRLRGYGNAINAVAAETFIRAFMEFRA